MKDLKITISLQTILIILLTCIGMILAYELRGLILSVFFAYIINAGLRPVIDKLVKRKVDRSLAIFLTYLAVFSIVLVLGLLIFSTAFAQVKSFFDDIDYKLANLSLFAQTNLPFLNEYVDLKGLETGEKNIEEVLKTLNLSSLESLLTSVGTRSISIIGGVVGGIFSTFVVVMLSAYMLKQRDYVYKPLVKLLPIKLEKRLNPILDKIEASLGSWLVGQLALMLIIGVITYFLLFIPGIFDSSYTLDKYALVFAIIAGLLEGIPSIGPLITLVIVVVAAILSGAGVPVLIFIAVSFMLLQQLEGVFIVPAVMKRAVDLHPILSIIGAVAGLQLGGPIGALVSIPIVATLQIIVFEVSKSLKKND